MITDDRGSRYPNDANQPTIVLSYLVAPVLRNIFFVFLTGKRCLPVRNKVDQGVEQESALNSRRFLCGKKISALPFDQSLTQSIFVMFVSVGSRGASGTNFLWGSCDLPEHFYCLCQPGKSSCKHKR